MINVKESVHLHNRFDFTLIDSTTGKVKQTAHAENVVLNKLWDYLNNDGNEYVLMRGITVGTGSGTPAVSDTDMFTPAFYSDSVTMLSRTLGDPISSVVGQVTFPASTSYVGNLTEVGLRAALPNGGGRYTITPITHAMLVDSEGNPIVINKTSLDVLVVTATLYMTITGTNSFKPFITADNRFLRGLTTAINTYKGPFFDSTIALYTCPTTRVNNASAIELTTASKAYSNKRLDIIANRLLQNVGNTNYISGIGIPGHGLVPLPNASIFPPYSMTGSRIGTGDGTTKDFKCPVPVFVKSSEVLYINGTRVSAEVYTIDNQQNAEMLSCISAHNFAEVDDLTSLYTYNTGVNGYVGFTTASSGGTNGYLIKEVNESFEPVTIDIVSHLVNPDPIVGSKVNTLYLPFSFSSGGSVRVAGYVSLQGSDDGSTWYDIVSSEAFSVTASGSTESASGKVVINRTFSEVTYRYIKASITVNSLTGSSLVYLHRPVTSPPPFVGYVGQNIHFNTAPASGSAITMDCTLDRPFKNENFVIDASLTVQL